LTLTEADLKKSRQLKTHNLSGLYESYECPLPPPFYGARIIGNRYGKRIQCYFIMGDDRTLGLIPEEYFNRMRDAVAEQRSAVHYIVQSLLTPVRLHKRPKVESNDRL
jgi:hypothetical protein